MEKYDFPACAFSTYQILQKGMVLAHTDNNTIGREEILSGCQFLRKYLRGELRVIGPYGVYDLGILRQMNGYEQLSDAPIGLFGEYLLLVRCGLFKNVAYINAPLVFYRSAEDFDGAWKNTNLPQSKEAGRNLIGRSVKVLSNPELRDDFSQNISFLLDLPLIWVVSKLFVQDGYVNIHEVVAYLLSLKEQFGVLKGSELYRSAMFALIKAGLRQIRYGIVLTIKSMFKHAMPSWFVKFVGKIYLFFIRHSRRYFWEEG